jgi:hypothetical protein
LKLNLKCFRRYENSVKITEIQQINKTKRGRKTEYQNIAYKLGQTHLGRPLKEKILYHYTHMA